jgi:hypothetical protein
VTFDIIVIMPSSIDVYGLGIWIYTVLYDFICVGLDEMMKKEIVVRKPTGIGWG